MQLTRAEIADKLRDILLSADDQNRSLLESCTESTKLATDLGLSSVEMLYMVIAIEESFGIRFENVGVTDFETLGSVIDYIEAHLP